MPALILLVLLAQSDARLTFLSRQLGQAKDPRARAQAALLLGNTHEPAAMPALCAALEDGSEFVRNSAARALGTLEEPLALECLRRHARDPDPDVGASIQQAERTLHEVADRPTRVYVAIEPLEKASPELKPELRPLVEERFRLKLRQMGGRLAPVGESASQARALLRKLGVRGFLLRPELTSTASGGLQLRVLCLTYPEKAILGEVSVKASGASDPDLIRALIPQALEDAADTLEWRP